MKLSNLITILQNKSMDKVAHYGVGSFIASFIYLFLPSLFGICIVFSSVILVGVLKEVVDLKVRKTSFSYGDIVATILGAVLPSILILVLLYNGLNI